MPKIQYIHRRFSPDTLLIVQQANGIIDAYARQGFDLTLRQLYYQFVSRDLISNNDREYKRLGAIVNDARLAGLIDWSAITDRTRNLRSVSHWETPGAVIDAAAYSFRLDKWADQPCRPEVWIEKDALVGVIERICTELDVPYFSCRGYTSQSEMWAAAQRLKRHLDADQLPVILHLGDHDPSGKDMTRDIAERLALFMGGAEVKCLALNMDQVAQYDPPPNPAKLTDARASAYIAEFGDSSWELDALEPAVLTGLIRGAIEDLRDDERWHAALDAERAHRTQLRQAAKRWDEVTRILEPA